MASAPAADGQGSRQPQAELTAAERLRIGNLDSRQVYQFNNADLADYLVLRTRDRGRSLSQPHPRQDAGMFARRSLGQPFRLNAVQFDPAEGDCVSCVNRHLALSLAWDWASYVLVMERIRHKDGVVEYKNRNFFTLQDWLPNNTAWLLDDVTGKVGPQGRAMDMTLPAGADTITVWFRYQGPPSETGVGFDWIKLKDLTAEQAKNAESQPADASPHQPG